MGRAQICGNSSLALRLREANISTDCLLKLGKQKKYRAIHPVFSMKVCYQLKIKTKGNVHHRPVSYTHLDVYKRQGYGFGARSTLLGQFVRYDVGWPMTGFFKGRPVMYVSLGFAF